jgi:hypothetical protein
VTDLYRHDEFMIILMSHLKLNVVLLQKEFVVHPLYQLQWVEECILDYFTVNGDISSSVYFYLSAVSTSEDAAPIPAVHMDIRLVVGHECLVHENRCTPCEGGIRRCTSFPHVCTGLQRLREPSRHSA